MSDKLVWEDPPERAIRAIRKTPYTDIAEELRDHQGQWAKLPGERASAGAARNLAQNIRRGTMKDFPKDHFEAVTDDAIVFVRYVGPPPDEPPVGEEPISEVAGVDASVIRAWALENGYTVLPRGRLSPEVINAYKAAEA